MSSPSCALCFNRFVAMMKARAPSFLLNQVPRSIHFLGAPTSYTIDSLATSFWNPAYLSRYPISTGGRRLFPTPSDVLAEEAEDDDETEEKEDQPLITLRKNYKRKPYRPTSCENSIKYLESDVYKQTYKGKPVWFYHRRNFKGHFPPPLTRSNCVFKRKLITSNPCPICRDEYLVLDYRNTKLLEQFINPVSSEVLETKLTGLCQFQHKRLLIEVEKARDLGTILSFIPFQLYDYSAYLEHLPREQLEALLFASRVADDPRAAVTSDDLIRLPVGLQDLLGSLHTIPHAQDQQVPVEETVIERPQIPNRYKMEEDYKRLLAKRRKSPNYVFE